MSRVMGLVACVGLAAVASNALPAEHTLVLMIENMDCKNCPSPVTRAIDEARGVLQIDVDATKQRVTVTYDDSVTDWEKIAEAAAKAGYQASRVVDAPVVTIRPDSSKGCALWSGPSRRDISLGVTTRRIERADRRCLVRSRRK